MIRATVQAIAALLLTALIAACTPQQVLLNAMVPDGTASMLLSHLQSVESGNRERIIELEKNSDWRGMIRFADTNITRDPFSAEWRMVGGYAASRLREFARAADYFGDMVRLAPDDGSAYHFLAQAQRDGGDLTGAASTLERALLVVRDSALTHQLLGDVLVEAQRYPRAIAQYRRALAIDPQFTEAWFGLGRAAVRSGRAGEVEEALQALEQARSPRAAELRALAAAR